MDLNRREFIGGAAMAAAGLAAKPLFGAAKPAELKSMLLHFGTHMWSGEAQANKTVLLHYPTWERLTAEMAKKGVNMLLIDIGEALVWPSHPEIALAGAWSVERFRKELARLRGLGLEPIPKINFSTTHNYWMGEYRAMTSSRKYMEVCDDLVRDCAEIFDRPRFLHLGFDEESSSQGGELCIARKGDLWYHDLVEHVRSIEKAGMRAWMWSDRGWHHEEFVKKCPKSVLQSNWYYDEDLQGFDPRQANDEFAARLDLFLAMDKAGFEQVPAGSNWKSAIQKASGVKVNRSMCELVKFARENLDPKLLKGFMMTSWEMTTEKGYALNQEAIDVFAESLA